ncbi:MAG: hypothetical protein LUF30_03575 [Lachnospiraceae bacterium]|nr:hypothetical protein [Lachnospiraceae bacterium]
MKKRARCVGFMAILLAAVTGAPSVAFADKVQEPAEELTQILETQLQSVAEQNSALEEYLGLAVLKDAINENGLQIHTVWGLTKETAALLTDSVPEDVYLELTFQADPEAGQWSLTAGAGVDDGSLLDLSVYGDTEMLVLTAPAFYGEALGIQSGSLLEQYEGSGLEAMLAGLLDDGLVDELEDLDLVMDFYPETSEPDVLSEEALSELEQAVDTVAVGSTIEKTEQGDTSIYTLTAQTDEILGLYAEILRLYLEELDDAGLLEGILTDDEIAAMLAIDDLENQMDLLVGQGRVETIVNTWLEEVSGVIGEKMIGKFYVRDNQVESIVFAAEVFNIEENETCEIFSDGGFSESDSASSAAGAVLVALTFADPEASVQEVTCKIRLLDYETDDTVTIALTKQSEQSGTQPKASACLEVTESGVKTYESILYQMCFDSATGEMDVSLFLTDPDTGEELELRLASTFCDVERGSGFTWVIDELALGEDGAAAGITGEISVQADPGTIEAPENPVMLFDLDEEELNQLIADVYIRALSWADDAGQIWDSALEIETEVQSEAIVPIE